MKAQGLSARLAALAVVGGTILLAPSYARADDDDDGPRKKRRMIVEVEDSDAEEEEEEAAQAKPRAPEVGDPPEEIRAYLAKLDERVRTLKAKLKSARRSDDAEKVLKLEEDLAEAKAKQEAERDRLTERNPGMIAGGATLVGLGSASFLASLVLVVGWGLSAIDGNPEDEYGWASLGCLAGGVVGIAAGTPLLVIGLSREPREASDARARPPGRPELATGLTLTVPF
jgi:hypothetical protein